MNRRGAVLFTAFEPSGDDHAAAVIAELRRRDPGLRIFAWGGPKMEKAGATLVERTGDDAVMGVPGLAKVREHRAINRRIAAWIDRQRGSDDEVRLHVPVDSPAANGPICAIAKARGLRVVHLVAPQIWAWGRWRIRTLRARTDLVLCVLPFEQRFFERRGVPARFIGHFIFDRPLDIAELDRRAAALPRGEPKLALMPGSRPAELQRNFPVMLRTVASVRDHFPGLRGVVACTNPQVEKTLRAIAEQHGGWPDHLTTVIGDTDTAVRWCDAALVKSGTVTLQVARQLKPMVIFYKKGTMLFFACVRLIVATRLFTLPNVLAARKIVPEFVPHFGGPRPIIDAMLRVLNDDEERARQRRELAALIRKFDGLDARQLAADAILDALDGKVLADPVSVNSIAGFTAAAAR